MRLLLVLVLASSCAVSVSLEGKQCAASEPRCLPGYTCESGLCVRQATGDAGPRDAGLPGCPLDVDPAANACSGSTWYLSPTGSDANDGGSPGSPRLTLPPTVRRGDVVHLLAGTYAQVPAFTLSMSGTASCPLLVTGDPDGGTVLKDTLQFEGAYFVFRHLEFNPLDEDGVYQAGTSSHVTFQFDTFRTEATPGQFPVNIHLFDDCADCVVRECRFESDVRMVTSDSPRFVFRGNTVRMPYAGGVIGGDSPVIEGNDFTGEYADDWLDLTTSTGARVSRNVFHDVNVYFPDKVMVFGAAEVSFNTFARITGNDSVALVRGGTFSNNLVTFAQWVVNEPAPPGGAYNIFDDVQQPYGDSDGGAVFGTDRLAAADFDGTSWVPAAGSAAVDGADPTRLVPPGGGTRADVGAFERGATRLGDGRYCLLDGGS